MTASRKSPLPIIRHLSALMTPVLLRLPVSANAVTSMALLSGLWAAWLLADGTYENGLWAAVWLIVSYVFDNCDGEVARAKGQASAFGAAFDNLTDGLVHGGLFAGLGYGQAQATGQQWWLWLGLIAGAGAIINYLLGQYFTYADQRAAGTAGGQSAADTDPVLPTTAFMWLVYFFRELSRADFCFLLLVLAALDGLWLLLPAAAVGAQVYWMGLFAREARRYRV